MKLNITNKAKIAINFLNLRIRQLFPCKVAKFLAFPSAQATCHIFPPTILTEKADLQIKVECLRKDLMWVFGHGTLNQLFLTGYITKIKFSKKRSS